MSLESIYDFRFDYRSDIIFRAYILLHNDTNSWKLFKNLKPNKKVTNKLFKLFKDIQKNGQLESFGAVWHEGKIFPASGATRLACLIALGKESVKVRVRKRKKKHPKWNDSMNFDTHHFKDMPCDIMKKVNEFRNLIMENNKLRKEYFKRI